MPAARQPSFYGPIAQWLEQTTHNRLVGGSNPSGPTIFMSTAGHQLIYDDVCGFCQRSVRLLRRVDWFRTIDPVPMSAAADLMARHSISPDAMMSAMPLVTRPRQSVRRRGGGAGVRPAHAVVVSVGPGYATWLCAALGQVGLPKNKCQPIQNQPEAEMRGGRLPNPSEPLKTLPRFNRVGTLRRA